MFETIVDCIARRRDVIFDDGERVSAYVDDLIAAGKIVKNGDYDFGCDGLVRDINAALEGGDSAVRLEAVSVRDPRIGTRVKGQGCYFILREDGVPKSSGIVMWGRIMITLHELA